MHPSEQKNGKKDAKPKSKVVNKNGEPMVLHHITDATDLFEFKAPVYLADERANIKQNGKNCLYPQRKGARIFRSFWAAIAQPA